MLNNEGAVGVGLGVGSGVSEGVTESFAVGVVTVGVVGRFVIVEVTLVVPMSAIAVAVCAPWTDREAVAVRGVLANTVAVMAPEVESVNVRLGEGVAVRGVNAKIVAVFAADVESVGVRLGVAVRGVMLARRVAVR